MMNCTLTFEEIGLYNDARIAIISQNIGGRDGMIFTDVSKKKM